jgi:WD40 repeat protein
VFHGNPEPPAIERSVDRLSFSPDGQTLSVGGEFATESAWNVQTGDAVRLPPRNGVGPRNTVASAFSPEGGLVAWSASNLIGVVPSGSDYFERPMATVPGDPDRMAFTSDGRVLAVGGQSAVRLFDAASLEPWDPVPVLTGYPGEIASIAFDATGRRMAVASAGSILLSDLDRAHRLGRVLSEPGDVCNACTQRSVSFSPDGRVVAWLDPGGFPNRRAEVRVWDVAGNREVGRFPVEQFSQAVAFDPSDGRAVTVVGRDAALVLSLNGGPVDARRPSPTAGASWFEVSLLPGGRNYGWSRESTSRLVIRDLQTGEEAYRDPQNQPLPVGAISGDGTLAVATADGAILLWDLERRRPIATLTPPGGGGAPVESLAYNGDGSVLASLSAGTISVWDVANRSVRFALRLGRRGALALSADGSALGAGSNDGSITVWDLSRRQLLGTVRGPAPQGGAPPVKVAFTSDGTTMASAVHGGGLMVWELDVESWREHACAVARRDLTPEERSLHVGSAVPAHDVCP